MGLISWLFPPSPPRVTGQDFVKVVEDMRDVCNEWKGDFHRMRAERDRLIELLQKKGVSLEEIYTKDK